MPATIRRFSLSDEGFARTSVREKHAEPSDTVQDITACTMQRQAKRLRAETEATAYSTIAPGFGKKQVIRGDRLEECRRETRVEAPFSSGPGADHLLFGKTKRRWGAQCAGNGLQTGRRKRIATPVCALVRNDVHRVGGAERGGERTDVNMRS